MDPGCENPKPLGLQSVLGTTLQKPFADHCRLLGSQILVFFESRQEIAERVDGVLFGTETTLQRWYNNVDGSMRWMLGGEAVEEPAPHVCLRLRTQQPKMEASLEPLQQAPVAAGATDVNVDGLAGPGDGLIEVLHLAEPASSPGYFDSDLWFSYASGSFEGFVTLLLALVDRGSVLLRWLASDAGSGEEFRRAHIEAFPEVVKFARRFVNVDELKVFKEAEPGSDVQRLCVEVPLDTYAAQAHYPRFGELVSILDPVALQLRHPASGDLLVDLTMSAGILRASVFADSNGDIAWLSEGNDRLTPLGWDAQGVVSMVAELECSLVPLSSIGITSMAAIGFPKMRFSCHLSRSGRLDVSCLEMEELPVLETVAYAAFDMQLFRQKLVKDFRLELVHRPVGGSSGDWAGVIFARLGFPASTAASTFSMWFRDFLWRQLSELDALQATADFFKALADDAEVLCEETKFY